jgi:hypothetical protein
MYDYSDAPPPRRFELIPPDEGANVTMHIRPGGVGEDGLLTRSKEGDCEMLNVEYTVVDGPYVRRKIFENQIVNGTTQGQKDMAEHYRRVRKQILESARNIKKGDTSPQARAAYQADLKDFDGLTFPVKIGVERGKPIKGRPGEKYDDKNIIAAVIMPGQPGYQPVVQAPPFNGGGTGGSATPSGSSGSSSSPANPPIEPPQWAR